MGTRRGRPSKSGKRGKTGRLLQRAEPYDYGNDRVQALTAIFTELPGSRYKNDVGCCIGKAYAHGLLEDFGVDAEAMRDVARDFARTRPIYYSDVALRVSSWERRDKGWGGQQIIGTSISESQAHERRFHRMMDIIRGCARADQDAFFAFACDYFDSDHQLPPFVLRLINSKRVQQSLPPIDHDGSVGSGPLSTRADQERMNRAATVMVAMVAGNQRRK